MPVLSTLKLPTHDKEKSMITLTRHRTVDDVWRVWMSIPGEGNAINSVQAVEIFSNNGIWGFTDMAKREIHYVRRDSAERAQIVAFMAHELDHIYRHADSIEESEQHAALTQYITLTADALAEWENS